MGDVDGAVDVFSQGVDGVGEAFESASVDMGDPFGAALDTLDGAEGGTANRLADEAEAAYSGKEAVADAASKG